MLAIDVIAQDTLTLQSMDCFIYERSYTEPTIDSVIHGTCFPEQQSMQCIPHVIYFDEQKTMVAYESKTDGDTCITYDYWRNGQLKVYNRFVVDEYNFPVWTYEEVYCENGQLIRFSYPNLREPQFIENYYCNGNLKNQFTLDMATTIGEMTWHWENGNKNWQGSSEKNRKYGIWQRWDEYGSLSELSVYEDNWAIEETKYYSNGEVHYYELMNATRDSVTAWQYDQEGMLVAVHHYYLYDAADIESYDGIYGEGTGLTYRASSELYGFDGQVVRVIVYRLNEDEIELGYVRKIADYEYKKDGMLKKIRVAYYDSNFEVVHKETVKYPRPGKF